MARKDKNLGPDGKRPWLRRNLGRKLQARMGQTRDGEFLRDGSTLLCFVKENRT